MVEEIYKEWIDWGNWLFVIGLCLFEVVMCWKLGDYYFVVDLVWCGIGIVMGWSWFIVDYLYDGMLVLVDMWLFCGYGEYYLMCLIMWYQWCMVCQVGDWLVVSNWIWQVG